VRIAVINGPNLNLLGVREPGIYGDQSFEEFLVALKKRYAQVEITYFQSNIEGELIDAIQREGLRPQTEGIILNPAGYSHTSIAIADAVKAVPVPVISVHISNIYSREKERHTDLIAAYSTAMVCGMGLEGYALAIEYLLRTAKVLKEG
jgi:3-dehydroquinate dehydratase-2